MLISNTLILRVHEVPTDTNVVNSKTVVQLCLPLLIAGGKIQERVVLGFLIDWSHTGSCVDSGSENSESTELAFLCSNHVCTITGVIIVR